MLPVRHGDLGIRINSFGHLTNVYRGVSETAPHWAKLSVGEDPYVLVAGAGCSGLKVYMRGSSDSDRV